MRIVGSLAVGCKGLHCGPKWRRNAEYRGFYGSCVDFVRQEAGNGWAGVDFCNYSLNRCGLADPNPNEPGSRMINSEGTTTHVTHVIAGEVTVAEINQAIAATSVIPQADVPVLWDLRDLNLDTQEGPLSEVVPRLIDLAKNQMSTEKRAFVVADQPAVTWLEGVLGRAHAPWPWVVFLELDVALAWLNP